MTTRIRLLLVDDHALVREGLRVHLAAEPGFEVVAEAADADAALAAAQAQGIDVVLMDIGLRGRNGIEATRDLMRLDPPPRVLMLSMHDNPAYLRAALTAGAQGYVLKDSSVQEIVQAVHALMAGQRHLSATLVPALHPPEAGAAPHEAPTLTPREQQVLALIADGLSSRAIGERLAMGVRTVETHRTNLRRKLQLASPAELVRYAVQQQQRLQPEG